ncbi:MAG: DUF3800 domain-containing protein [Corynebacterium sp.]|nr:DUF3800 domain-containing protein [Corynebacterium sp.]
MLIAYLDEFGHQGPYIRHDHPKYNTHPVFGYAGYVLPADNVRELGGYFEYVKSQLLAWEISRSDEHPRRWEKKGSALLTTQNMERYGEDILPAFNRLFRKLGKLNGKLFFFGQQKPLGPVSQTHETSQDREEHCLIQAINRLGTFASSTNEKILVIMDATDTDNRERAVSTLGKTIYARQHKENRSIIEIPVQADSRLYGTIQLADWSCALLGRLTDYHFAESSGFAWSVDMARDIFRVCSPTNNSILWSNAPSKDSRCYPNQLLDTTRFWQVEARAESRKTHRAERNQHMLKKLVDAGSPEFRHRLKEMRNTDGD